MSDVGVQRRPQPLTHAVHIAAPVAGVTGAMLTTLTAFGLITFEQETAVQTLLVALVALFTALTGAWAAYHVRANATPHVTPVADPRDAEGHPLVPAALDTAH